MDTFWNEYTSENSRLPFLLPFSFFLSSWFLFRVIQKRDFARFYKIHTTHHVGALICACLSLYFQDNAIFHERIGILWSMSYFIIDIVDCLLMQHFTYIAHGVICLGLSWCNYTIPLHQTLRMNSKAAFIETSSIILYQVKQNRNPVLFGIFAIVYTLCRIVWIPFIMKELYDHDVGFTHPIQLALIAFYGLQVHWWIKIIKIALNPPSEEEEKKKDK